MVGRYYLLHTHWWYTLSPPRIREGILGQKWWGHACSGPMCWQAAKKQQHGSTIACRCTFPQGEELCPLGNVQQQVIGLPCWSLLVGYQYMGTKRHPSPFFIGHTEDHHKYYTTRLPNEPSMLTSIVLVKVVTQSKKIGRITKVVQGKQRKKMDFCKHSVNDWSQHSLNHKATRNSLWK